MARRRPPPEPVRDDPYGAPEQLRRCYVEDWVDPRVEPTPADLAYLGMQDDAIFWAMLKANRRCVRARAAWEHEHDLEHHDLARAYGAIGRPRFHDRAALEAAISSRLGGAFVSSGTSPGRDPID